MFAYDSASSSSSSPPARRYRLVRKRSPSPSSNHYHSHHSPRPYSPSSREADIARLLDPAYASPAPYSPLSKSPMMAVKEVYVDHHGDLHDPDFRDFPPFGHSHFQSRRPCWESTYGNEEDSDDEETQVEHHRSSFEPQRRRPSSTVTYHPPPIYYPYDEPASYESRFLAEDEDEEGEQLERVPLKEKSFCRRPRSPTKAFKGQDEKRFPSTAEGDQVIQADSEWTPTCTQNLRRHWQAITLSLRFSLFRTKRRLRRRVTG
ncbi:hypothetical protein EV363DRAFT_1405352 [Boletus edulis]|nr:hypothetical protein EV363DRAFT_1405352 [Boletus edulis]